METLEGLSMRSLNAQMYCTKTNPSKSMLHFARSFDVIHLEGNSITLLRWWISRLWSAPTNVWAPLCETKEIKRPVDAYYMKRKATQARLNFLSSPSILNNTKTQFWSRGWHDAIPFYSTLVACWRLNAEERRSEKGRHPRSKDRQKEEEENLRECVHSPRWAML